MSNRLHNPDLGPLNDFKNFLYLVWMYLPDIQKAPTRIQYDIADYLQHCEDPWTIIMAYRGIGKSYITASFVVWLWLVNPQFKILVLSAAEDKAKDFAHLVRQIINGLEICEHLKPGAGQRDSVLSFDVGPAGAAKDPSLNVYGIGGMITGGRADFIIPDDIETLENASTVANREKLRRKLNEVIAIIKPALDGHKPQIKMLGTPQSENSIYFALESEGYRIRIWPARYPTDLTKYGARLAPLLLKDLEDAPSKAGAPINPLMHNEEDLTGRATGRRAWFLLQYMLDPSLSDAERYPLKLKDFIMMHIDPLQAPIHVVWSSDPRCMVVDASVPVVGLNGDRYYRPMTVSEKWQPYEHKLLAIDPAGGGDETAYCVLYFLMGYIYVAAMGGFQGGIGSTMESLASLAAKHKVNTVLVERNFGAAKNDNGDKTSAFTELFKPVLARKHRAEVETVHVSGQKERRICDAIEMILADHRVIISEEVVKKDYESAKPDLQGLWQLTHITRDRGALIHDDRVDAMALGFDFYINRIKTDVTQNEDRIRQDVQERNRTRWLENALRGKVFDNQSHGEWLTLGDASDDVSLDAILEGDVPWWSGSEPLERDDF